MKTGFPIPVVVVKEEINGKDIFTASTPLFDIASQGKSVEAAVKSLREAVELFLEEPGIPIHTSPKMEVFTSTEIVNMPAKQKELA
mgnify:CR=1 FL=1